MRLVRLIRGDTLLLSFPVFIGTLVGGSSDPDDDRDDRCRDAYQQEENQQQYDDFVNT